MWADIGSPSDFETQRKKGEKRQKIDQVEKSEMNVALDFKYEKAEQISDLYRKGPFTSDGKHMLRFFLTPSRITYPYQSGIINEQGVVYKWSHVLQGWGVVNLVVKP